MLRQLRNRQLRLRTLLQKMLRQRMLRLLTLKQRTLRLRMQLLRTRPRLLQTRLLPRIPRLRRLLLSKDYLTYDKKDIGRLVNVFFMLCVRPAAYRLGLFSCNHFWNLMHICSNIRE